VSEFDADTRLEPAGDGAYDATVTDRWNALGGGANGGYLLALCVQALARELAPPDPLAISAFFLRPGATGPARLRTETARSGRRIATGEARLLQDDNEVVRAVASFTDLAAAHGPTDVRNAAPDLPPPEACLDMTGGGSLPGLTITDRFEYRMPQLPGWTQGKPSGEPRSEFWIRFKDGRAPDTIALPGIVDAAAPVLLELGHTSITVELTVHVRGRPAPGWLACRVSTRHLIDGVHEEDFEIWDSQGRLVAQSRQLGLVPG
jgi:acyl-CoA thioesterase